MNPVIAVVSVRPAPATAGISLHFEFPPTGETVDLPLPGRGPLEAVRRKAGYYLSRLVPLVAETPVTGASVGEALRLLLNSGRELASLLAGGDRRRMLRLQEAFQVAWPTWEVADWDDPVAPVPVVQVNCATETFPLELLPLFGFGRMADAGNDLDLARAAARLLGFSCVVQRLTVNALPDDHVLRNEPALPVQFLRHRGLGSVGEEERFLGSLHPHVSVEGPWPEAQDDDAVRHGLLRALFDGAALSLPPGDGLPPVQVQHFACHCDTSAEHDDDYTIVLSTRRGRRRSVTFGELRQWYHDAYFEDPRDARNRAVIILNACASSRTDPVTASSFPRWFLEWGHRAFIGTETDVPDDVAAAFAACLYGRLLERRRPLGEAVVRARRDLLRDYRSPLGILYVMYGDADLTVERSRPGVHRAG